MVSGERRRDALGQIFGAKFVHQEADRAAVHAVDQLAGAHRLAQRLQQETVAAQRHDHVGIGDRRLPVGATSSAAAARASSAPTTRRPIWGRDVGSWDCRRPLSGGGDG